MVDYSYVELSSAAMKALMEYRQMFPNTPRAAEIKREIPLGVDFIKRIQRPDGSWYGSWAVCFTYGTWFGIEALVMAGERVDSPAVLRAVDFLLSKQNSDGGWGEDFLSCVRKVYVDNETSQVVNTSWALLALMAAETTHKEAVDRGVEFLMSRQLPNGDWKQESISGVFNGNCSIAYESYKNVFPIWALGRYYTRYNPQKE